MRRIWPVILCVIIIALVGVCAYLFGQNQGIKKEESKQVAVVVTGVVTPTDGSVSPQVSQVVTVAPTKSGSASPVIIIESEGSYPAQDVSELKARVINPFVDYHAENSIPLVSFKVSKNNGASKDNYPYMADAILSNGGNEGFLISRYQGHIDWWLPGCINGCNLSPEFKAKYPEIASKVQ